MRVADNSEVQASPKGNESSYRRGTELVRRHRRKTLWRRVGIWSLRLFLALVIVLGWEFGSGDPQNEFVLIDEFYVSTPTAIVDRLWRWIAEGVLWHHVWVTFQETGIGFAIGTTGGLVVGFIVGGNRFIGAVLSPFITALYSVPRLALIPLFIIWFGLGMESKIAMVAIVVFFLVFFNTYSGVTDVDQELIDVLRVMNARSHHIYGKVVLPSAMVWILTGMRVSAPYALVAAVTAEMISSNQGMGFLLIRSAGQFNIAGVFAAIWVMVAMSLVVNGFVMILESVFLRWKRV